MVDYERDYWSKAKDLGQIVVLMKRLTGAPYAVFQTVFLSSFSFLVQVSCA
jgi:hypothetical protein